MQAFTWDPSFETHIAQVDAQHRRLVNLIDRLGSLLAEGGALAAVDLERTHRELAEYAARHFADEERLMAEAEVDPRHRERHHRDHETFREYVEAAMVGAAAGEESGLLTYLVHWLTLHILGSDQSMARQIHAIRAGSAPADAYQREAEPGDAASQLLLRSVRELFEVISGRNRELTELNRTLEERVAERTRALSAANAELRDLVAKVERMAMTDSLTDLPNRRYAMRRLAGAWATAVRHGHPLSCLIIDADGFKEVNDSRGHEVGDQVLVRLAQELRRSARESDEVCRVGGDEFLVICPDTALDGALSLAERMRAGVSGVQVELDGGTMWNASVSVGAAALREGMASFDDLLRAADAGVYQAKRSGRNRVAAAASDGGHT